MILMDLLVWMFKEYLTINQFILNPIHKTLFIVDNKSACVDTENPNDFNCQLNLAIVKFWNISQDENDI